MANFYYGKGTDDLWVTFLTHTEERRLFRRFYAGLTKGPNPKDISGDTLTEDAREARDQIITQFLRFCAKYAIRFAKGRFFRTRPLARPILGCFESCTGRNSSRERTSVLPLSSATRFGGASRLSSGRIACMTDG